MIKQFDMELTDKMLDEYNLSTKEEKGTLLAEYCKLTGVKQNTAAARFCRALNRSSRNRYKKKRGRKKVVFAIHKLLVKRCWILSGCICGERLFEMRDDCLCSLAENGKLKYFNKEVIVTVRGLSVATIKRIIATFPKPLTKKKKGAKKIYQQVPIKANFGQYSDTVGNIEIDYVEHNGGSSSGRFAITGCYVDIYSGWTVRSAGFGKNQISVDSIHETCLSRIYHKIIEFHPDNFDQIIKALLARRLDQNGEPNYSISRSRPYKKNDNAHVEQKNNDKVRNISGYRRYDTGEEVAVLNEVDGVEDLISNFFIPSQKLIGKIKNKQGRVIGKKHDTAKTPYLRLIDSNIPQPVKNRLKRIRRSLNLVELRQRSNMLKRKLARLNDKKYELTTPQKTGFDDT